MMMASGPANTVEREATAPYYPVSCFPLSDYLIRLVPEQFARVHRLVPISRDGDILTVAMADPSDLKTVEELGRITRCEINPVLSSGHEIEATLDRMLSPRKTPDLRPAMLRVLQETGFLTSHQVRSIQQEQGTGHVVASSLSDQDQVESLGLALYLPKLRLDLYQLDPSFCRIIPRQQAEVWRVLALFPVGEDLVVAASGLPSQHVLETIRRQTGYIPRIALCTDPELDRGIERAYATAPRTAVKSLKPIAQQLVEDGSITRDEARAAQQVALQSGEPTESVLRRLGLASEESLLAAEARIRKTLLVRLGTQAIDIAVAKVLPEPLARRYRFLVLRQDKQEALVAMADLGDWETVEMLEFVLGTPVNAVLADEADLQQSITTTYGDRTVLPAGGPMQLGSYLERSGRLTSGNVAEAIDKQKRTGDPIGKCLVELGHLSQDDLAEILGLQMNVPWVTISRYATPAEARDLLPESVCRQEGVVPLYKDGQLLTVAAYSPSLELLEKLGKVTGFSVRAVLGAEDAVNDAVEQLFAVDLTQIPEGLQEFGLRLVRSQMLNREQLLQLFRHQLRANVPFDTAAVALGYLTEEQVTAAVASYLQLPRADLRYHSVPVVVVDALGAERQTMRWMEPVEARVARQLPEAEARRYDAIPMRIVGNTVEVAFVLPLQKAGIHEIEQKLGLTVVPFVSTRTQVEEAIRRVYGRRALGDLLLEADVITRRQLEEGLALHQKTGIQLGKALISLGHITQENLAATLAQQQDLPHFTLAGIELEEEVARSVPEEMCRGFGLLPVVKRGNVITLATVNPLHAEALAEVARLTGCKVEPVIVTEGDLEDALERIYKDDYLWKSANDLVFRYPDDSASRVLTREQKIFFIGFLVLSAVAIVLNPILYFSIMIAISTIFYICFSTYKFYLIYKSLSHDLEIDTTEDEMAALDERDLPIYTVLVPLYRESEVLPTLVRAIDDLDYPKAKLDVKLLLEEDDTETIATVRQFPLPSHIKPVIVPHANPKGKPKACNYGLLHAEGEYVVIYDAEDIPDRDQLKRALIAFRKAGEKVGCIQAKLNYYNRDQNLLTRWFTTEYSMWFDLFIPGLDASNAPIPLGGTSNHFRTSQLRELGAWDPHNVTEDADLGVRLFKAGWKTAVIDSTTYEEANSELYNWIRQRSRWVKGYIQTYLVHMRHPVRLARDIGLYQFFSFNMVVGGTFFGFLMNPVFWLLTALWFLTKWTVIHDLFPAPIFYLGALGLYFGNFAFMYTNVAGCMRRQYYDMVKYALISPLYWALMSVGAWKGFLQLFYRPSYWEKTKHGLYKGEIKTEPSASLGDLL